MFKPGNKVEIVGPPWVNAKHSHDLGKKAVINYIAPNGNVTLKEGTYWTIYPPSSLEHYKEDNMDAKEAYRVLQANCGIENGDKVKVLRVPKEYELGSSALSAPEDAKFVGKVVTVHQVGEREIRVEGLGHCFWGFPFFCLELVEKAKPKPSSDVVSFTDEGVTAGGIFISKDTIRRNLDL